MPASRSLLSGKLTVDSAKRGHNCQHVRSHRIEEGDRRLKVPKGRSFEHFCVACGLNIIQRDITKLRELLADLEDE